MIDRLLLDDICAYCRNYFFVESREGTYKIENGTVALPFLADGQYFRIVGSVFNDGVWQYPCNALRDEEFTGEVWALALPPAFLAVCEEVATYSESPASAISGYTSESWGGYSYTKGTDQNGVPFSWQTLFGKKLNRWRKL